jgi:hypothetical protein
MSRRGVQIVLLCEDQQQEVFMRRFLKRYGYRNDQIRHRFSPKGKQSGEQFVRTNYPIELKAYKSKAAYVSIGFVVMIDADLRTVDARIQELDEACDMQNTPRRSPQDRVSIFVPKRNIETWIYYLDGKSINETMGYQKLQSPSECEPAVARLAEICQSQHVPVDFPNSLERACEEFQKIR